ncbi:MAG: hypothetical protein MUF01_18085 [Bryobacterales bacterium]|jgi:hypothetical protein|nr:hypothetical protein [Bryobacterales bacterium]
MISPHELVQEYWGNCYAVTETGARIGPITVNKYRMYGKNTASHASPMKTDIINRLRSRYKKITGKDQIGEIIVIPNHLQGDWYPNLPLVMDRTGIVRAFNGKSSPEDIELALAAAIATKQVEPHYEALQKMADRCMGLDCNGFVGNYTKRLGMMKADGHYGPNTPSSKYAADGLMRESQDQVQARDVLIWDSPRHIAIVHSVCHPGDALLVTESASSLGGLDTRWYHFTGKVDKGPTGVSGRSKGVRLQFARPKASGGHQLKYLLVCKIQ